MQSRPNAVAHKFPHHAEAIGFHKFLDGSAHISDGIANSRLLDALIQRGFGDLEQLASLLGDRSVYRNRDSGIAVIAIHHHTAVDRNNVARLQRPLLGRDAMDDFLIDRGAEHARIVVVTLECRLSPQFLHLLLGSAFQLHGGDPGSHPGLDVIEHFPDDASAVPHLLDLRR